MENLDVFISNNILLIVLWFVLLYMIINASIKAKWDRSPLEVVQLLNSDDAVLVDVREDNELQAGKIANAIHIPLGQVKSRISELEKHKNKTVVINCRSGHRSARACSILRKAGFEKVYNLRGGILAWESDKLPVQHSS